MRWLPLQGMLLGLLLAGCNAPEDETYETRLTIVEGWENTEGDKPVYNSLNDGFVASYLLSDAANQPNESIYSGNARFRLLLNGIDITNKQRVALCGSESFGSRTVADPDNSEDPIACQERLDSLRGQGYTLTGLSYSDGFVVTNVGSGGKIKFHDLQSLDSALITGTNILTLQPIPEAAVSEAVSVEFVYYGQGPSLYVDPVTLNNGWVDSLTVRVGGDASIKKKPNLNLDGTTAYEIQFYDMNGKRLLDSAVHFPLDFDETRALTVDIVRPSNLNPSAPQSKAHLSYVLTDSTGIEHKGGFLLPGYKTKDLLAVQLNRSGLDIIEPVLNPMIQWITGFFIDEVLMRLNLDGAGVLPDGVTPGDTIQPRMGQQLDATLDYRKSACSLLLNNTLNEDETTEAARSDKNCTIYATIDEIPANLLPRVNVNFVENGEDGVSDSKLAFDVVLPNVKVNLTVVAFDRYNFLTDEGRYLGHFKTTINFKELALRDTLDLDIDSDYLIKGLDASEGYTMRADSELVDKLLSVFGRDAQPTLGDSECVGCPLPVEAYEAGVNYLGVGVDLVREGLEGALNSVLPDLMAELFDAFPDIKDIKKTALDNRADQVVDTGMPVDNIRNVSATWINVKDMNPLGFGFAPDRAGEMVFSGGYKDVQTGTTMLADQQYPTAFLETANLPFSDWQRYACEAEVNEADCDKGQLDMVIAVSANAINQYISSSFQVEELQEWLTEQFVVNSNSGDKKIETLSRMVSQFDTVIDQGDEVIIDVALTSPPQVTFTKGKKSFWQYSYDLLFGFLKGGKTDEKSTPAVKISFHDANVVLRKVNGGTDQLIFDVDTDFSLEANVGFENGLPKFYVKTPEQPVALYEAVPDKPLDKRFVVGIKQVNRIAPAAVTYPELRDQMVGDVPADGADPLLKVLLSSAFVGVYQDQIQAGYDPSTGAESFFDDITRDYLRENYAHIEDFRGRNFEITYDGQTLRYGLGTLFGNTPVLIKGNTKWFTVGESGSWIHIGLDFNTQHLAENSSCERGDDGLPAKPFTLCFE